MFWPTIRPEEAQIHISNEPVAEMKEIVTGRIDDFSFLQVLFHDDPDITLPSIEEDLHRPDDPNERPDNSDDMRGDRYPNEAHEGDLQVGRLDPIEEGSHEDSDRSFFYFGAEVPEEAREYLAEAAAALDLHGT